MVIDWLEKEDLGKRKTQYKLRDWFFLGRGIGESQCQSYIIMMGPLKL